MELAIVRPCRAGEYQDGPERGAATSAKQSPAFMTASPRLPVALRSGACPLETRPALPGCDAAHSGSTNFRVDGLELAAQPALDDAPLTLLTDDCAAGIRRRRRQSGSCDMNAIETERSVQAVAVISDVAEGIRDLIAAEILPSLVPADGAAPASAATSLRPHPEDRGDVGRGARPIDRRMQGEGLSAVRRRADRREASRLRPAQSDRVGIRQDHLGNRRRMAQSGPSRTQRQRRSIPS